MRTNLISANDYKTIQSALERGKDINMERCYKPTGQWILVNIVPSDPMWGVPYLIRVQQEYDNIYSTQYFKSVEEMRRILK